MKYKLKKYEVTRRLTDHCLAYRFEERHGVGRLSVNSIYAAWEKSFQQIPPALRMREGSLPKSYNFQFHVNILYNTTRFWNMVVLVF